MATEAIQPTILVYQMATPPSHLCPRVPLPPLGARSGWRLSPCLSRIGDLTFFTSPRAEVCTLHGAVPSPPPRACPQSSANSRLLVHGGLHRAVGSGIRRHVDLGRASLTRPKRGGGGSSLVGLVLVASACGRVGLGGCWRWGVAGVRVPRQWAAVRAVAHWKGLRRSRVLSVFHRGRHGRHVHVPQSCWLGQPVSPTSLACSSSPAATRVAHRQESAT